MQTENLEGQESIFDRDSACGKMSSVLSQVGGTLKRVKKSLGRIFKKSSKRSSKLKNHTFMLLDLRPGAGNMLGAYWEYDPPWLGSFGTLNTSECPKDVVECSLWQILQATAPSRYSLSQTACLGSRFFCWSWRKRRDHWISEGRSAHTERQPQRELYAQHPLYQ